MQVIKPPRINHPNVHYNGAQSKGVTVLVCGHPGTWKSTWAAGWPGVVFCSIAAEGGDESLRKYPEIARGLVEKTQMKDCPPVFNMESPPVFEIRSAADLRKIIKDIVTNYKAWGICTVVIDSLTYLIDLWLNELILVKEKNDPNWKNKVRKQGGELFGPPEWGLLNNYLRAIRVDLSNCGLNVIWTCLQNDHYEQDERNMTRKELVSIEPMITGKNRVTLPGSCNLHIWADRQFTADLTTIGRQKMQPVYWTSPSSKAYWPRHRYGYAFPKGKLQDPEWGDMPTFRAVWAELHPYIYVGQ